MLNSQFFLGFCLMIIANGSFLQIGHLPLELSTPVPGVVRNWEPLGFQPRWERTSSKVTSISRGFTKQSGIKAGMA